MFSLSHMKKHWDNTQKKSILKKKMKSRNRVAKQLKNIYKERANLIICINDNRS